MKPVKVTVELRMFYCLFNHSLCRTQQRSDWPGFMRKTCLSPFKPYLQLRGTLLSNIYAVEMHPWQKCYCSWTENWRIHLSQKRKLPLLPFASVTTFRPHSFSQQHQTWSELCQTAQHHLVHRSVTKRLTWRNWTLQSDWRALYRPRGTNHCMAVLPDPFSIFPKGVWARDYAVRWSKVLYNPFFWKVNTRLLKYHTGWNRLQYSALYHRSWQWVQVETTKRWQMIARTGQIVPWKYLHG